MIQFNRALRPQTQISAYITLEHANRENIGDDVRQIYNYTQKMRPVSPLVWGSLRLAPISLLGSVYSFAIHHARKCVHALLKMWCNAGILGAIFD